MKTPPDAPDNPRKVSHKGSRQKGSRLERAIVEKCREYNLEAKRVPLSGAAEGFKGDVLVKPLWTDTTLQGECKWRAAGFKQIYDWLGDNDFLAIKANNREILIVQRLDDWVEAQQ